MKKTNIIFIIAMMFALTLVCHAKTADEIISEANEFYSGDISAVSKLLDGESEYYTSMIETFGDTANTICAGLSNSYPGYNFINIGPNEELTDFESQCLSDSYYWVIVSEDGYTNFRNYEEGKWKWSSSSSKNNYVDKNGNKIVIDESYANCVEMAVAKIGADKLDKVKVAKYDFHTILIYARGGADEYVIPYTYIPDNLNIETGKLYTAVEFIEALRKADDAVTVVPEGMLPQMYGGSVTEGFTSSSTENQTTVNTDISQETSDAPAQSETSTDDTIVSDNAESTDKRSAAPEYVIYIAVAVGVLVIAVVVFAVIRKKRIK